jgi:RND family efflux transporter MFP subunit
MMNMHRFHIVAALACLFLSVGLAGCGNQSSKNSAAAQVAVAHPIRQDVVRTVDANGTTQAIASVDLVARITGTLEKVAVKDGAMVHKGDVLFIIEPAPYSAKVSGAEGEVAAASAALTKSQLDFARQESLAKANATSKQNLDAARSARDTAAAQLIEARADLTQARINLGYTRVTAPFDGVMTNHRIDVGGMVAAGAVLATVVEANPIRIAFSLSDPEASLVRRAAGTNPQAVEVSIGLSGDDALRGRLDYVAPAMNSSSGTLDFRVLADNSARSLLPGSYVHLRIPVGMARNALLVPSRTVGTDQTGRYVLIVDAQGTVRQKTVTIEPGPAGMSVLASGISANDRVIVADINAVSEGDRVRPVFSNLGAAGR